MSGSSACDVPAGRSCDGCLESLREILSEFSDIVVMESGNKMYDSAGIYPDGMEIGPSGQNAVLTASGLALGGKRVFISASYSPLFVARAYEQIRASLAIPNLKVVILSAHDWVPMDGDGASRQMWEDLALMRVMPNMTVLVPSDKSSAYMLTRLLAVHDGPAYMRLSCAHSPDIYKRDDADFAIGGARLLAEGDGVTILACGIMVSEALKALPILAQQGIKAEIIDCYSIKPFPEQLLIGSVRRTGCCVVAEKHTSIAGLYGAVSECLCRHYAVPVRPVSIEDGFGQSGTPEELQEYYGLTYREIVNNVIHVLAMRRR